MKNLFPLALVCLCLLFQSCKDDDDGPVIVSDPSFETAQYSLLTPGNYWIYERYSADDNGVLTLTNNIDSSYVEKDTTINGLVYHKIVEQNFGSIGISFLRDSASYIISSDGQRIFGLENIGEILSTSDDGIVETKSYMVGSRNVVTALGDFEAVKKEVEFIVNGESSIDKCGLTNYWLYAKDVGVLRNDAFYYSNCDRVRRELVRYNVQ